MSNVPLKKKLATSVCYDTDNGYTVVTLYSTQVVKFNYNEIILNTGGHETRTTNQRMNQASKDYGLGYNVYQKNYNWYVEYNGIVHEFKDNKVTLKRKF